MNDFTTIPILDLALARSPATKPQFLAELQHALVRVGFLYVKNHSIPEQVSQASMQKSIEFFQLPIEKKLELDIDNTKHWTGYCRKASEYTLGEANLSEGYVMSPGLPGPGPGEPAYLNMRGPNQWPEESAVPGFRKAQEDYRSEIEKFSTKFIILTAESLGLEPSAITRLLGDAPNNILSLRCYQPPEDPSKAEVDKGLGPHKDPTLMTYLLQQGDINCLEVQNKSGAWIPVPPIPGTLVVNLGNVLEVLTNHVCTATTHRVLLKPEGFYDENGKSLGPRVSIGFFQDVDLKLVLKDSSLDVPSHIADLVKGEKVITDADEVMTGLVDNSVGDICFTENLICNQDWGRRWYPELVSMALKKQSALPTNRLVK